MACFVISLATALGLPVVASRASAAGVVTAYVFAPTPIGTTATKPVNTTVMVAVTAEDHTGAVVPGATIYLSFAPDLGGGQASVSGIPLALKPMPFVADVHGKVTVAYRTPGSYPAQGSDVVKAEDGAGLSTSTVVGRDSFCFSPITAYGFVRRPIAKKGTLPGNVTIPVTMTVLGTSGPLANTPVFLTFNPAANGGSAAVNGTALTATARQFTTDSSGNVVVNYHTPNIVPKTGTDVLISGDAASSPCVRGRDSYDFSAV